MTFAKTKRLLSFLLLLSGVILTSCSNYDAPAKRYLQDLGITNSKVEILGLESLQAQELSRRTIHNSEIFSPEFSNMEGYDVRSSEKEFCEIGDLIRVDCVLEDASGKGFYQDTGIYYVIGTECFDMAANAIAGKKRGESIVYNTEESTNYLFKDLAEKQVQLVLVEIYDASEREKMKYSDFHHYDTIAELYQEAWQQGYYRMGIDHGLGRETRARGILVNCSKFSINDSDNEALKAERVIDDLAEHGNRFLSEEESLMELYEAKSEMLSGFSEITLLETNSDLMFEHWVSEVLAIGETAKQLHVRVSSREIKAYAEAHHYEMTDRLSKDRAAYWCLRNKVLETLCPMEKDVFSD